MSARSIAHAVACTLLGMMPGSVVAAQEIVIGPYTFPDESPFADDATWHPAPLSPSPAYRWYWYTGAEEHYEWRLVGYSPESGLINLGSGHPSDGMCPSMIYIGRELLDFHFVDVSTVNGPGPDLVIFDARYSYNTYEVAVQPRGGALTSFRFYPWSGHRPTGATGMSGVPLLGVEIDLTNYGIPPGVEVDLLRIAGDEATNPCVEIDVSMAAVLNLLAPATMAMSARGTATTGCV